MIKAIVAFCAACLLYAGFISWVVSVPAENAGSVEMRISLVTIESPHAPHDDTAVWQELDRLTGQK